MEFAGTRANGSAESDAENPKMSNPGLLAAGCTAGKDKNDHQF